MSSEEWRVPGAATTNQSRARKQAGVPSRRQPPGGLPMLSRLDLALATVVPNSKQGWHLRPLGSRLRGDDGNSQVQQGDFSHTLRIERLRLLRGGHSSEPHPEVSG